MPPKRKIEVNADEILLAINKQIGAIEASFDNSIAYHQREAEKLEVEKAAIWTNYNLPLFSGDKARTDSEKKVYQRAIREMVHADLIDADTDGRGRILSVRLSEAGKARVEQLQKPSGADEP